MDPCLLADPFLVSGWGRKELGAVESVKVTCSGLVMFVFLLIRGSRFSVSLNLGHDLFLALLLPTGCNVKIFPV